VNALHQATEAAEGKPEGAVVIRDHWLDRFFSPMLILGVGSWVFTGGAPGAIFLISGGLLMLAGGLQLVKGIFFCHSMTIDFVVGKVVSESYSWKFRRQLVELIRDDIVRLQKSPDEEGYPGKVLSVETASGELIKLPAGASKRYDEIYGLFSRFLGRPVRCKEVGPEPTTQAIKKNQK